MVVARGPTCVRGHEEVRLSHSRRRVGLVPSSGHQLRDGRAPVDRAGQRRRAARLLEHVEDCVAACRTRFAEAPHVEFHTNDGKSLDVVDDRSIDLAFSFDSLVHADIDVLSAYLRELARTLTDDGVAFIHHSNLGDHLLFFALLDRIPARFRDPLVRRFSLGGRHWRDPGVTAGRVEEACNEVGLSCIRQELVNWGGRPTIDCFTTLTRAGSARSGKNHVFANRAFMDEAKRVKRASKGAAR